VGVVAAGLLVISAGFYVFMWWEMSQLDDLRAEITQDQATIADLAKRGGKLRINTCGGRICIEASGKQDGNWTTNDGRNVTLFIPKGY
jgi:hypothetical protein